VHARRRGDCRGRVRPPREDIERDWGGDSGILTHGVAKESEETGINKRKTGKEEVCRIGVTGGSACDGYSPPIERLVSYKVIGFK